MKRRVCGILLIGALLLTACSTAGTSSEASAVSAPSSTVESKAEASSAKVLSTAKIASGTAASSTPEPIQYMSYKAYFSESRPLEWQYHIYSEGENRYQFKKDGQYMLPFAAGFGMSAETKTGLLLMYDGKVYEAQEPGQLAKLVFAPDAPYQVEYLYNQADEHCFFVQTRSKTDKSKFQMCRIFRPTGQVDVLATEQQIPGDLSQVDIYSNTECHVISCLPYDSQPDMTGEQLENLASFAQRTTIIDTLKGMLAVEGTPEFDRWLEESQKEAMNGRAG